MIIYKIINNITGKIYIGQTRGNLSKRICNHVYENKSYIQRALNKYGISSFTITVIDYADTLQVLNEKEEYWIRYYDCKSPNGYNLKDGGSGKNLSDVSRKKISDARKGMKFTEEHKKNLSLSSARNMKGKKHPEEVKKKMSLAAVGRVVSLETRERSRLSHLGKTPTMEARRKQSEMQTGRKQSKEAKEKVRQARLRYWANKRQGTAVT